MCCVHAQFGARMYPACSCVHLGRHWVCPVGHMLVWYRQHGVGGVHRLVWCTVE